MPAGVNGPTGIAADPLHPERLYLAAWARAAGVHGEGGGVYVSEDAGQHWKPSLSSDQHIYDVTLDPRLPGTVYASGFESSAWVSSDFGGHWQRISGFNFKWGHRVVLDPADEKKVYITTYGGGVWHGAGHHRTRIARHRHTGDGTPSMTKRAFAGLAFLILALLPLRAQVQVYEGTLSLPFYQEGPPNPNPPFDLYATSRFNYPYVLRDNLTSHREDRMFRAVYLENEYLKCSVLPDVGGHVYSCIDKIDNVPMFYQNPSIKEAAIGMRGGWAAFGLEFNFPVSHNWMTVSPVDFGYAKEKDGSASITVSNIDRVYGMQWTVRLVLHPGSTLLEQQVTLNNRSDVRHRFYWWSNAGVQAWDDTRICYPMRYSAAHGFADVDRWPVDSSGTDLSLYKNHTNGPVSRFVHGSREPFMGIWSPHTNSGIAHYANYAELPGKKIWSWGVDADAMDWRKALSDNNSAYVEVQAGLFRNQETYAFLEPRQTIHFTEYWMPLHELGGLSRANLSGAVNLTRTGDSLTAALNVNTRMPQAEVRMLDADQVIYKEHRDSYPRACLDSPDFNSTSRTQILDRTARQTRCATSRADRRQIRLDARVGNSHRAAEVRSYSSRCPAL